jgi:hypothetical protein
VLPGILVQLRQDRFQLPKSEVIDFDRFGITEDRQKRLILFRVVVDRAEDQRSALNDEGDLCSRCPAAVSTCQAADEHFSWNNRTSFISFFNIWQAAQRRRDCSLGRGSRNVLILAYDGSQMTNLVDTYKLAKHMGYDDSDSRHRLRNHRHEILA